MNSTFYVNGYKVVREFLTTEECKKIWKYTEDKDRRSKDCGDEQVPNSSAFYNDDIMSKIHRKEIGKMEKESGLKLFKTYCYWRMYHKDAILKTHTDRPACEISASIYLGGDPWSIFILNRTEEPIKVDLEEGDALLYKGCELHHWRTKFKGNRHAQLFLHYVDQFGNNAWAKDDSKK